MANNEDFDNRPTIKTKLSPSSVVFYIIAYLVVGLMAIVCLAPFVIMISGSFTSEQYIAFHGFNIIPKEFTVEAYKIVFKVPEMIARAYGVSILVTIVGTVAGLFLTSMTAFVLSRQDFKYRYFFSFFFYFTTLFSGGMVCTYIFFIRYLHLKNSLLSIIFPGMFSVFNLLIMRSFISALPSALVESAKIDGASDFRIYITIILPLIKSGLATIGLFMALAYWNDWYNAMLYIDKDKLYPLQYMLYNMLQKQEAMARMAAKTGMVMKDVPSNSLKMAMAVVATGPILIVYPFVQKYFVKGVTVGSVKG